MNSNKKIAVFIGDYFWSSIPYDGLNLYHELKSDFNVDLLMFEKDIRLNKEFSGDEKFFFEKSYFTEAKNLKTLKDWSELFNISKDYSLLLSSTHIAPKTRYPRNFNLLQCKWGAWDIGGVDLLVNAKPDYSVRPIAPDYFFVKGEIWKQWIYQIKKKTKDSKEFAFSTGCPHYDYYLEDAPLKFGKPLDRKQFISKYQLDAGKNFILVTPSNPSATTHNEQFDQNMEALSFLNDQASKNNTEVLLKTYPHDYVFYEGREVTNPQISCCTGIDCPCHYTGVYHRRLRVEMDKKQLECTVPHYSLIKEHFPNIKIIDSQDHFSAVKYCEKIFNIAGSSISWETYLTSSKAFSMNYSNKTYFNSLSYLPNINFPDKAMNHEIAKVEGVFDEPIVDKSRCNNFILKEYSLKNIKDSLKYILNNV